MSTSRRESVTIGEAKTAGSGTILYTLGIGSCVAIVLWDGDQRIGGLAHALLPEPRAGRPPGPAPRYATTAVDALVTLMESAGAGRRRLRARLAGGASMFDTLLTEGGRQLGMRNVAAARSALARAGIPIDREDVGGTHGRSVYLHVDDGHVIVTSVMQPDVIL
jgi:chemotaxis protein CheD